MVARRQKNNKSGQPTHDQVAKTIFAAESMGISNRKIIEKFVEQVSQRLEVVQIISGMEHFVSQRTKLTISPSRIRVMVKDMMTAD